ncbi:hypothetical protein N7492_002259 [Penicillium capsulatum]|uniref:Uncharacterized protein n=1 Tax=Penicillium capsulatum TaxID=69766 RepID=A0A9W9LVV4_9EURO|nr:hypothetical protein N7492_002259 [Penicillium capsulatum]KAJ6123137.1 hypothetical protein N7512_005602 [Penicillium capsulatum]
MSTPNETLTQEKPSISNASVHSSPQHPFASVPSDHSSNSPHLAAIQMPGPAINLAPDTNIYEGYTFFLADPIPGQTATWTRVERTQMHLPQSEFYRMVQKRATKFSAAQQYQNLFDIRRAHVNQLIHEKRRIDPQLEWSCVYAKESDRPSKPRNAHPDDYETVSMHIILMKRPMKTNAYPRTPMGDLVDLATAHRQDKIDDQRAASRRAEATAQQRVSDMPPPAYQPVPSPNIQPLIHSVGRKVQGPLPRPMSVTPSFTRLDLASGQICDDLKRKMQGQHAGESTNEDHHMEDWDSEASSSDDEKSTIFDHASVDVDSATDITDTMDSDCQEPPTRRTQRAQSRSPRRREPSFGPHYRKRPQGPISERKERYSARRYSEYDVLPPAKSYLNHKRTRSIAAGPLDREKMYRIQRINDQELRTRLLECETRIEQWERVVESQALVLQKLEASQQLKPRRSYYDPASMRH